MKGRQRLSEVLLEPAPVHGRIEVGSNGCDPVRAQSLLVSAIEREKAAVAVRQHRYVLEATKQASTNHPAKDLGVATSTSFIAWVSQWVVLGLSHHHNSIVYAHDRVGRHVTQQSECHLIVGGDRL